MFEAPRALRYDASEEQGDKPQWLTRAGSLL